jgi:CRP-like cAMP-binding protein
MNKSIDQAEFERRKAEHYAKKKLLKAEPIASSSRLIGCPLWWLKAVLPVVHGPRQLAVALFLYRLRVIHRSRTVPVTNVRLLAELGIDRRTKYQTIKRLERAGLIAVQRHNKKTVKIIFAPAPKT